MDDVKKDNFEPKTMEPKAVTYEPAKDEKHPFHDFIEKMRVEITLRHDAHKFAPLDSLLAQMHDISTSLFERENEKKEVDHEL